MDKKSVNKVILIGNIGNAPQIRYTPSGIPVTSFSLATNETWIDSDNKRHERTEWHNIIAWNKLADFTTEYLHKGQLVYIEGKLQTRIYTDKEDIQRKITEVVSNVITPLEWKDNKEENKDGKSDKELPF